MSEGDNVISGQAFLRQRGGDVITCAGSTVELMPSTDYIRERIRNVYGTLAAPARWMRQNLWNDAYAPGAEAYLRRATCNAQGTFRFEDVPDGQYFIETSVFWMVGDERQGSSVMAPVSVAGGEAVDIVISP